MSEQQPFTAAPEYVCVYYSVHSNSSEIEMIHLRDVIKECNKVLAFHDTGRRLTIPSRVPLGRKAAYAPEVPGIKEIMRHFARNATKLGWHHGKDVGYDVMLPLVEEIEQMLAAWYIVHH